MTIFSQATMPKAWIVVGCFIEFNLTFLGEKSLPICLRFFCHVCASLPSLYFCGKRNYTFRFQCNISIQCGLFIYVSLFYLRRKISCELPNDANWTAILKQWWRNFEHDDSASFAIIAFCNSVTRRAVNNNKKHTYKWDSCTARFFLIAKGKTLNGEKNVYSVSARLRHYVGLVVFRLQWT